jgi:hypothetical protein
MTDLPLSAAWQEAQRALRAYEQQRSQEAHASALQQLRALQARVQAQHLFSANEDGDDLQTSAIKYMLLPGSIGELLASQHARDPLQRAAAVASAVAAFEGGGAAWTPMRLTARCCCIPPARHPA